MSRAKARRWLHGLLHGLPCLPCADATAPVAQPCYPATEPNSYRSLRYHFIVRLTLISSHPWPQQARQVASGRAHNGMGSRCVHRCLTQIHARLRWMLPTTCVGSAGLTTRRSSTGTAPTNHNSTSRHTILLPSKDGACVEIGEIFDGSLRRP